jgi:hypothetical protein
LFQLDHKTYEPAMSRPIGSSHLQVFANSIYLPDSHRPIFVCFVSVTTFLVALKAPICSLYCSANVQQGFGGPPTGSTAPRKTAISLIFPDRSPNQNSEYPSDRPLICTNSVVEMSVSRERQFVQSRHLVAPRPSVLLSPFRRHPIRRHNATAV